MAKKDEVKKPHFPAPDFSSEDLELVCTRCGAKENLDGECDAEGM